MCVCFEQYIAKVEFKERRELSGNVISPGLSFLLDISLWYTKPSISLRDLTSGDQL